MRRTTVLAAAVCPLILAPIAPADEQPYRRPPAAIVDILEAPPLPSVSLDPTRTTMLMVHRRSMPTIAELSEPMLRLAGRRINPNTNAPHGGASVTGFSLRAVAGGAERRVDLPEAPRYSFPAWAPDGRRFAFSIAGDREQMLAVVETATGRVVELGAFNALGGYTWMPDSRHLLVHRIPADRGDAPLASTVPTGPVVQESSGRTSPVRTYQDLLQSPHDEALFEHHFTSELALVDVEAAPATRWRLIGEPAVYMQASPSPDARFLLVSRIERPYSYLVPMWSFPQTVEVWDLEQGSRRELVRKPLADQVPIQGVPTGPRSHQWRSVVGTPAVIWVEALDGGDPNREVAQRDRLMVLTDPMHGDAEEVTRFEDRYAGVTWIQKSAHALVSEYDRDERWTRTWRVEIPAGPTALAPTEIWSRSVNDRYAHPGSPVRTTNAAGRSVAMLDRGALYLDGAGATPEGDRPFLDRMDLMSRETERLWQCEGEQLESFVVFLDVDAGSILTRRETAVDPPNYQVRDFATGKTRGITRFEHPAPQLRDVHKELVTYTRDDGVELSATLYLPPGYDPGVDPPLPLIVWAYPREFNDRYTAGQVRGSPYRFTTIRGSSHLFLLLEGYAIMDAATMPVVGPDPETVNDTFIAQIVASAQAAIDYAADRGVADPTRVGVGGHSYGAFMTANLLAHCDLFSAGIARSGAYNRTLTPFGFQSERRTFWEAPDVYFELSPFMHAHQINEPLLLIHGERDNNSGTFPIQSRRLYHAVRGHGGTVRLVMLPQESHGYRSEESIMHVLAEMVDWFELHVKRSDTWRDEEASGG